MYRWILVGVLAVQALVGLCGSMEWDRFANLTVLLALMTAAGYQGGRIDTIEKHQKEEHP
jgi:uncharacterized membrane protein